MNKVTYATRIDALPDLLKVIDTCKLFTRNKDVEEMRQMGIAEVRIVGLHGGSPVLVFTGCLQLSDALVRIQTTLPFSQTHFLTRRWTGF